MVLMRVSRSVRRDLDHLSAGQAGRFGHLGKEESPISSEPDKVRMEEELGDGGSGSGMEANGEGGGAGVVEGEGGTTKYAWELDAFEFPKKSLRLSDRGRKSAVIYDFFATYRDAEGRYKAKCRLCPVSKPSLSYSKETYSNLEKHLMCLGKADLEHRKALNCHMKAKGTKRRRLMDSPTKIKSSTFTDRPYESRRPTSSGQRRFEILLAMNGLAPMLYRDASGTNLRKFEQLLRSYDRRLSIPTEMVIRDRTVETAVEIQRRTRREADAAREINEEKPFVHLSCGFWMSPFTRTRSYFLLKGHWMGPNFETRHRILSLEVSAEEPQGPRIRDWVKYAMEERMGLSLSAIRSFTVVDENGELKKALETELQVEVFPCMASRISSCIVEALCSHSKVTFDADPSLRHLYEQVTNQLAFFQELKGREKELLECCGDQKVELPVDVPSKFLTDYARYDAMLRLKKAFEQYFAEHPNPKIRPFSSYDALAEIVAILKPMALIVHHLEQQPVSIGKAYLSLLNAYIGLEQIEFQETDETVTRAPDTLTPAAGVLWKRLRQELETRFMTDEVLFKPELLTGWYLDPSAVRCMIALQRKRREIGLSTEPDSCLITAARDVVKKLVDVSSTNTNGEIAQADKLHDGTNMSKIMMQYMSTSLQSREIIEREMESYESCPADFNAKPEEWWSGGPGSGYKHLASVARKSLLFQASAGFDSRDVHNFLGPYETERGPVYDMITLFQLMLTSRNYDVLPPVSQIPQLSEDDLRRNRGTLMPVYNSHDPGDWSDDRT